MPYDDPDPEDPMVLVGVALPAGEEARREMAWVFAEEYARMGFDEPQILSLFRRPFFAGAHDAYLELGEETIAGIVKETLSVWGRVRPADRDSGASPGAGEEDLHE